MEGILMVLSLDELKSIEPRRYCSECDNTKPISEFPTKNYGLKDKPGKICTKCTEKHKQPKIEAEILGISSSKPLLKDLNTVKEANSMYEDEEESRTKECAECREFKPLDEFDTSKKICEECVEEMEASKKRVEKLKVEKEDEEDIKKTCSVCGNDKTLKRFGFDSETNKIKDVCKICERIGRVKEDLEPKKIESKYCSKCDTEKPVSEFYKKVDKPGDKLSDYEMPCKKCKTETAKERRDKKRDYVNSELDKTVDKSIQAKESTEKRALELLNENSVFMKRYKITVKLLVEKFGIAKSTAGNYMRTLVDKGLFKEQGRGNGRSWSYIGKDEKPVNKTVPIVEKVEPTEIGKAFMDMPEKTHPNVNELCNIPEKPLATIEEMNKIEESEPLQIDPEFRALLTKMWNIRQAKRVDYNAGAMNNFELTSNLLGIPSHVGILVRMSDKLSRLGSFHQKGYNMVKDESIEDTLLDLANYSLLYIIEYRKSKGLMENGL
jgi:hypothetical protein